MERSCTRRYETTRSLRFLSGTNNGPPPDHLVTNQITNKGFQAKGCSQIECKNHLILVAPSHFSSRLLPLSFSFSVPQSERYQTVITASERLYPDLPMETVAWVRATESASSSTALLTSLGAESRKAKSASSQESRGR